MKGERRIPKLSIHGLEISNQGKCRKERTGDDDLKRNQSVLVGDHLVAM